MSEPAPAPSRTPYVVAALIALLVIAGGLGFFVYQATQAPPPLVPVKPVVADAGVPEPTPAPVSLADGDALLKNGAAGLSGDPEVARWLALPDIVRRLVAAMVQVSDGESPREMLSFLVVPGEFTVTELKDKKTKKKKTLMSPASPARYDAVTKAIGSIDPVAAGKLYAKVLPFAESVLREIAPPGKKLDAMLQTAIDNLVAVPLVDGPVELIPPHQGIGYKFTDPKLEALSAAQKHLLRMGPTNARVVVDRLKAFRAATVAP